MLHPRNLNDPNHTELTLGFFDRWQIEAYGVFASLHPGFLLSLRRSKFVVLVLVLVRLAVVRLRLRWKGNLNFNLNFNLFFCVCVKIRKSPTSFSCMVGI